MTDWSTRRTPKLVPPAQRSWVRTSIISPSSPNDADAQFMGSDTQFMVLVEGVLAFDFTGPVFNRKTEPVPRKHLKASVPDPDGVPVRGAEPKADERPPGVPRRL